MMRTVGIIICGDKQMDIMLSEDRARRNQPKARLYASYQKWRNQLYTSLFVIYEGYADATSVTFYVKM